MRIETSPAHCLRSRVAEDPGRAPQVRWKRVGVPASRAASSAWKTHRPSIARWNLALGFPCAVTALPVGPDRQGQPNAPGLNALDLVGSRVVSLGIAHPE